MGEIEEFVEALLGQLSVEINEEKEIADLTMKIKEDPSFDLEFYKLEDTTQKIFPKMAEKLHEFLGLSVSPELKLEYPDLLEFKKLKGKKVYTEPQSREFVDKLFEMVGKEDKENLVKLIEQDTAKFLAYSTYAKAYLSKISTTYGDYYDSKIYLNKFVLKSYPEIILYKQGQPFEARFEQVNSGYLGALKMTVLEEQIHSVQKNLYDSNEVAVKQVNSINEELARIILDLDKKTTENLSEYLKIELVPDDFPIAQRANLFFTLNPDNFIVNVLGPDVMTYTKVEVDPKISEMLPQLSDIYQRWLKPIQTHHAAFTTMEGMADYSLQNILKDDTDFQNYLTTFMGTDPTSYEVRKSMGKEFTQVVFEKLGKNTFSQLIENPPTTRELKEPQKYLTRIQ